MPGTINVLVSIRPVVSSPTPLPYSKFGNAETVFLTQLISNLVVVYMFVNHICTKKLQHDKETYDYKIKLNLVKERFGYRIFL